MKTIKSHPLIYIAFVVSFIALLIFYLVAYTNLQSTLSQTEDERVVLKMMYHLDKFQTALTNIETNNKPSLIQKKQKNAYLLEEACKSANNEILELEALSGEKNIPEKEIRSLDSLFKVEMALLNNVIQLSKKGNHDSAITLLGDETTIFYRTLLIRKFNSISNYGRNSLKAIQENRFNNSKNIVFLMGILSLITLSFLVFIFWRLLVQTNYKDLLLSQNKVFADIINNTSDSILIYNKDFNITFCNAATEKLYKLTKAEIIGRHTLDSFRTDSTTEGLDERLKFLYENGVWLGERSNIDAEGNPFELLTNANSIKDEQGNITGFFAINTNISQLKKAQKEVELLAESLKKANEHLEERVEQQTTLIKEMVDRVKDGFLATDSNYTITYVNNTIGNLLNLSINNIEGENLLELFDRISDKNHSKIITESFKRQEKKSIQFFYSKNERWYQSTLFPSESGLSIYFKDITKIKKSEEDIQRSKRLYEFISKVNDLILHAKTAEQIYSEICEIAISSGGLLFAWVGIPDEKEQLIKPHYMAGYSNGYLQSGKVSTVDNVEGMGPTGRSYRTGKYYYCNDISNDPVMAPWRNEAVERGYLSSIGLPIKVAGKVESVLTMYASKAFFFTEDEVQLLLRVADNVSYALTTFNIDTKRKAAEKQLHKVSQAVAQSSASIVITNLEGKIEYVNPAFSKLTGYTFDEAVGQNPKILKSGYTSDQEYTNLWKDITHFKEWHGEFLNKKKNGETYWEYAVISPIVNEEGVITNFVAVKENISEIKRLAEEQKELIKIFENTTAYVATADLNQHFLYMNKAMREILKIDEYEDITKLNINDFRSANGKKTINNIYKILYKYGRWIGENYYQNKDGIEIPVWQVIVLHKNDKGEPIHISTTALNISKNKEAEKELYRLNNELRELSKHLRDINETDKREIAREIHDELGQGLTALKFGVSWVKRHINDNKVVVEQKIDDLLNDITETMKSFRRIYTALHPAMLEELGLHGAVQWLVNSFSKSSNITTVFTSNIEYEQVSLDKSLALYRVVQESLTNIMRYAKASNVSINFQKQDNFTLALTIEDDGIGFDVSSVDNKQHHGLLGMRERMYSVHGRFNINSIKNKGTIIYAEVPLS